MTGAEPGLPEPGAGPPDGGRVSASQEAQSRGGGWRPRNGVPAFNSAGPCTRK